MISHILVKSKAKLVSLQNPGQPMGWPGWPVTTALDRIQKNPFCETIFLEFFYLVLSMFDHTLVPLYSLESDQKRVP